jgi:hypothetical protein
MLPPLQSRISTVVGDTVRRPEWDQRDDRSQSSHTNDVFKNAGSRRYYKYAYYTSMQLRLATRPPHDVTFYFSGDCRGRHLSGPVLFA